MVVDGSVECMEVGYDLSQSSMSLILVSDNLNLLDIEKLFCRSLSEKFQRSSQMSSVAVLRFWTALDGMTKPLTHDFIVF
jgi:hypothetical protein